MDKRSWPAGWRMAAEGHAELTLQPWAGVAYLDEADAVRLCHLPWYAHRKGGSVYVRAHINAGGKDRIVLMHRLIMEASAHQLVDHANRNGLDNRRLNLRFATRSQNAANARGSGMYSQYRGVTFDKRRQKWVTFIKSGKKQITVGSFACEEVAAAAYDIYARAIYGEFASSNLGVWMGTIEG